jgi:hypothetical protein
MVNKLLIGILKKLACLLTVPGFKNGKAKEEESKDAPNHRGRRHF